MKINVRIETLESQQLGINMNDNNENDQKGSLANQLMEQKRLTSEYQTKIKSLKNQIKNKQKKINNLSKQLKNHDKNFKRMDAECQKKQSKLNELQSQLMDFDVDQNEESKLEKDILDKKAVLGINLPTFSLFV